MPSAHLQASFRPDPKAPEHGQMVWWGGDDPAEAARKLGLPDGSPARVDLAVPHHNAVSVTPVPARLTPLDQAAPQLAQLPASARISDSMRAWRAAATLALTEPDSERMDALAAALPAAACAYPRDGSSLWAPKALLAAFHQAVEQVYLTPSTVLLPPSDEVAAPTTPPAGVQAQLRPYQSRGVTWLTGLARHHRGGVLADDMGLGKTLQAIALMAGRSQTLPHLVVCPTSVLGNWARELERFAPDLPVVRHHGPQRSDCESTFPAGAVVVTSYAMLLRDVELLARASWDVLVLDEAQQIKNHTSQTAKAARRIPARTRLAMTGTPVENRLTELWSLMDFVNPGLLGSRSRFSKRYAGPVETRRDPAAAQRLRDTVRPYLLRRLKSDVAVDLPAKQESTVTCTMTAEQAKLYRQTVEEFVQSGFGVGITRHGRILKLLTQLKQICNHPAQFLGQTSPLPRRSGKLERACEMLAETISEGHQSLVFTQYRVMGELLVSHLSQVLELDSVPFLHGGVSQSARDAMVDRFQSGIDPPPILVVSLKAGGTGLNLTAATHVLHYDRWWNPAVEDQATDRAHRIGQNRTVDVHKLVTGGTLEERIDQLLRRKRSVADSVVGSGEDWITNFDDAQLQALVALSESEVAG